MEDYNILTIRFHIPQRLALAVVPIIYRSISEHTKHLSYSCRSWYYRYYFYISGRPTRWTPFRNKTTVVGPTLLHQNVTDSQRNILAAPNER